MPRPGVAGHESVIRSFYESFPYPWKPMYFDVMSDPYFWSTFVRQETGRHELDPFGDIWVAGCGTNQALITALQHPQARVLGTDASARSLELCENNARAIGVTNLELRHEGIAGSSYAEAFDLVVCTGVIHHNVVPGECLQRLSAALRPQGLLELMVYNFFHRREPRAFQEALGILVPPGSVDPHERLLAARALAASIGVDSSLTRHLHDTASNPEEAWADRWMNPCEDSYTVDSLWDLAHECDLVLEAPRLCGFDKLRDQYRWTLDPLPPALEETFHSLEDRQRWQLVNLLHMNASPMLWFYLRPNSGTGQRVTESDRNAIFLDSVLQRPTAVRSRFRRDGDGGYTLDPTTSAVADWQPLPEVREVWEAVDGQRTGHEVFAEVRRSTDFDSVYRARLGLTTVECPHVLLRPPQLPARGLHGCPAEPA